MPLKINEETCIGCGTCVAVCADIFVMDDENGKAKVKEGVDENASCVQEGIDACPVQAITK